MSDPTRIFLAETDADLARCFPVMVQLRPKLTPADFLARVRRQAAQGYRLAALESADTGPASAGPSRTVRSLAGFRLMEMLYSGPQLYIDDLITDSASRSQQHGEKLFAWVRDFAIAHGCAELHLDSGVHRAAAHRFYFRQRMFIDDFHFALKLPAPPA
ncbi:MAG: GNAT family N-acetyltransferase [Opitutae bacterium]|nr:GNAT family N-acetyltransferase [Opitutae bacterium]